MIRNFRFAIHAFLLYGCLVASGNSAETVRIAVIEPLSGPPAVIGKWWSNHVQMAVDQVNAKGGVLGGRKIETVPFDSKSSPQEALIADRKSTRLNSSHRH